jgi:hypothetical protein
MGRGMTWLSLEIASRMRERGSEVGDAGQEDGVRLMIMVGKEDELVPVVLLGTELHELAKGLGFAGRCRRREKDQSGLRASWTKRGLVSARKA